MKLHLIAQTLAGVGIVLGAIATLSQSSYAQGKFFCGRSNGQPVTMVRTSRGNIPIIRWVDNSFSPPWTPLNRCYEISARFERFYDNGILKYIKAGWSNSQPILCVAGDRGGSCLPNGLLVMLKPGSDPQLILQRLLDRRVLAAGNPIDLSGGENHESFISPVNTDSSIDLSGGESDRDLIFEVNGEMYFNIDSWLSLNDLSENSN